jgi:hypothetical protein
MSAYRGEDGTPLWKHSDSYNGPPILHHTRIITQTGGSNTQAPPAKAYDLLTGELVKTAHPLTGETIPWGWIRFKGCNTAVASEHLLTFRSASGCYADLGAGHGTTSIGGFKSGCTSNLVVADGLLNAPDYTRTCTCSYQNQTSFALFHLPDDDPNSVGVESWSFDHVRAPAEPAAVKRVGINFGAPGNRLAEDGTLWLEVPSVGGPSPDIPVSIRAVQPRLFREHMSSVVVDSDAKRAGGLSWVSASGVEGVTGITVRIFVQPQPDAGNKAVQGFQRHAGTNQLPARADSVVGSFPTPQPYTVRLHFAEPRDLQPGDRVFDVAIQGRRVLEALDIARAAGGTHRAMVQEVTGIGVKDDLEIELTPSPTVTRHPPLLCGIEIVAED